MDAITLRLNTVFLAEKPEFKEALDAINTTNKGKAHGMCGILAEIKKRGEERLAFSLYNWFCRSGKLRKYHKTGKMLLSCSNSLRNV